MEVLLVCLLILQNPLQNLTNLPLEKPDKSCYISRVVKSETRKKMKNKLTTILILLTSISFTQGSYAPSAGTTGTTAIHADSTIFVAWAGECKVFRGLKQISNPSLGYPIHGDSSHAIRKADAFTVSLGDSGYAIYTLATPVYNGTGNDFAVFENSFNNTFLELAFVEVSSDGINYFRFPSVSTTQDTLQIGGFGAVDCTNLYNLAGKYKAKYGTPFDLDDIPTNPNLNINRITHIKIVDAIGSIDSNYASYDSQGNKVNDPFPTPFPSGGFDLDALGLINISNSASVETSASLSQTEISIYPNPFLDKIKITSNSKIELIEVYSLSGVLIKKSNNNNLDLSHLNSGVYIIKLYSDNNCFVKKIIKK